MARSGRPRVAEQTPRPSALGRVRAYYYRFSVRTRLAAGAAAVVATALITFMAGGPVLLAASGCIVAVAAFAALMRSADAVSTIGVSLAWIIIAQLVFQQSLGFGSPWLLVLVFLPLPVALAAARIRAYPAWHTTLLALACALIVGLAVIIVGLFIDAAAPGNPGVPPVLVVVLAAAAAAAALLWRAIAGRHSGSEPAAPEAAGPKTGTKPAPEAKVPVRAPAGAERAGGKQDSSAPAVPVDEALAELEQMIGLEPVKQQVRSLAAAIEAARLRADAGISVDKPLRHLVFSGPPGTGKTSVARTLATILHSFGLLPSARVVEVQRADLVGEYLGATAIKTNGVVESALGGVLFIDEAYSLVNTGDGQPDRFGQEAVQTLLKRAEDDRDQLVVILAGYAAEMDRFLSSNPGLASRFSTRVSFPSYTPEEMMQIAQYHFARRGDHVDPDALPALRQRFDQAAQLEIVDDLGNGRFVRSLAQKAAEARDVRVVTAQEGSPPAPEELLTVRDVDIARAFEQLAEGMSGYSRPPALEDALAELDRMVGMEPVKHQVRSMAAQLRLARLREERGLQSHPPMRHFVFVGPPGTGKTTVARVLGRIFAALGLLTRAEVVEASRADLVGEHLGATAIKTNKLIDSAMGGVLFIDEAYALANPGYSGGDAFGAEAIQTLLKRAEDDRSRLAIVLAGYSGEMDRFLASNSGLASRFNVRVTFPSYAPEELLQITEVLAHSRGDTLDPQARADLRQVFGYVCAEGWIDELGNGRFARSLLEKACSARDLRVAEQLGDEASAEDLTVVTSEDLRQAYGELTQP